MEAWREELRRLREDIDGAKRALAAGQIPESQPWKDPELGRIPPVLRAEAGRLHLELENIHSLIQAELEKNQAERDRLHVTLPAKRDSTPVYLDVQG